MVGKTYLRYVVGPQGGSVVSRAALTMDAATAQETYVNTEEISSHHHYNNYNNYDGNNGNYKSNMKRVRGQSRQMHLSPTLSAPAVLFVPALEAVHVYAVRTGKLLHTLIPSGLTMPVEVTSLRVYSRMHEEISSHVIVSSSGAGINETDKLDNGNNISNNNNNNNNQDLERSVKRKSNKSNKADQNVVTYTQMNKVSNSFTSIARHGWMLLVGYSNGYVALFDCGPHNNYGKPICVFYALGHKIDTNVLSLCCNAERMYGCSGGQDTDLTIWDLTALEPVFRLRGHRGAIVGIDFINRYNSLTTLKDITHNNNSSEYSHTSGSNNNDLSATAEMYNTQYVVSSSADGLLKIWDITLRQCVQSILVADTPLTAMMVDECGRRVYCGMREGFIKVYSTDSVKTGKLAAAGSLANNNSSAGELPHSTAAQEVNILHDHGSIARKYHKPITSFHFSSDDRLLLACTSKTIEVYKVLSAGDVRRKVQRKRQRQRQSQNKKLDNNVHKSQQNEELYLEEEESAEHVLSDKNVDSYTETEGNTIANALYDATAAEEVILLRTFFMSDKVRSACFVPSDEYINPGSDMNGSNSNRKSQRGSITTSTSTTDTAIHIAVTFANNSILTYITSLTSRDTDGSAMATLTDLRVKFTFTERSHHGDIKHLCFVNNDSALLSMSAERVLLWSVKVEEDLLDVDHVDRSDFYDAQEANLKRTTFKGNLNCVGSVAVTEATAMTAISSSLCCVGQANGSVLLIDVASSEVLCEEPNVHVGEVKDVRTRSDRSGFLSLGADRRLVLWTVGLLENNNVSSNNKNGDKSTKHKVTGARAHSNGNANSEEEEEIEESSSIENVVHNGRKGDKLRKKHSQIKMHKKLKKEKEENELELQSQENENDTASEIQHTRHSQATLIQVQEIELAETPLFAQFSNEDKFLAVGLQNNTIQLFFADSFKPYLALFGHKLPPTCVAFTSDNTLVASTGMDKSLRFWGTDFGDCHRAIHAHDDYVTAVVFQPETHYAFTASLDGSVKMWDGDNWTMVQLFRQHQRGLWSVCVTYNGTCLASAGVDRTIRCFLRTQDIVFPEEEEEKMAQEAMDEENAIRLAQQRLDSNTIEQEVGIVGHPTASTAEAAEQLMEALDLVSVEQQRKHNPEDKAKHPLLVNCTEWEYLWSVIESIRPSELRHALSALTSVHVDALFSYLHTMLREHAVHNYEIASKVMLALLLPAPGQPATMTSLRTIAMQGESTQATSTSLLGGTSNDDNSSSTESEAMSGARRLMELRKAISRGLDDAVEVIDYNIAALQMVRSFLEENAKVKFYDLSAIQGYKRKYHNRLVNSSEMKS